MLSIKELQMEQLEWQEKNFPQQNKLHAVLGVGEEAGELFHAVLKREQKIRGDDLHHEAEMIDAIGDIVIFLMSVCNHYGYCLETIIELVWGQVKQRDWTDETA